VRFGVIVVAGLLIFAAAACDSESDSTAEPPSTTRASTSTTAPPPLRPMTTRWHPIDKARDPWPAALAALGSAPTAEAGLEHMLPILRRARELPTEQVTGRVVEGDGDETVVWISWRGLGDDSVSGTDLTIRTTAAADGLEILGAAARSICARGIGGDRLACL
jgi:hypothetical protein